MLQKDPEQPSASLELQSPQHLWKGGQANSEHVAQFQAPCMSVLWAVRVAFWALPQFCGSQSALNISSVQQSSFLFLSWCREWTDFALRALKHLQLSLKCPLKALLSARGWAAGQGLGQGQHALTPRSANASSRPRFFEHTNPLWPDNWLRNLI